MQIITCDQRSEEWDKCRVGKFTASSALAIATQGKGLETLALQKAIERVTGEKEKTVQVNEYIQHGIDTENEARIIYELETGNKVEQVGFVIDNEWVGCSPDGLVSSDGLIEIKCPSNKVYAEYLVSDKVDNGYYHQMQMQMLITKRTWCDYVVYNSNFGDKPIIIKRIYPDKEVIDKIADGLIKGIELTKQYMEKMK